MGWDFTERDAVLSPPTARPKFSVCFRLWKIVRYPRQSRGLVFVSRSKRLNVWAA